MKEKPEKKNLKKVLTEFNLCDTGAALYPKELWSHIWYSFYKILFKFFLEKNLLIPNIQIKSISVKFERRKWISNLTLG